MFTGIIEEVGIIEYIRTGQIQVRAQKVLEDAQIGDSIATNGVCLTITAFTANGFTADVMAETLRRSNLGNLKLGSAVNLERAMRADGRFGGHMVSGHIDGTGQVIDKKDEGNAVWFTIQAEESLMRYIVEKGSIAIDGISLTVATVTDSSFQVSIIPHTQGETTLLFKKIGDMVNLETDMVPKYIERLLYFQKKEEKKSSLDIEFLERCGF
ncbi:MAG: riboflavin synthase [Clostridiales bacterium]|nr:riboflavin synthase [Clostridiales bacterium]